MAKLFRDFGDAGAARDITSHEAAQIFGVSPSFVEALARETDSETSSRYPHTYKALRGEWAQSEFVKWRDRAATMNDLARAKAHETTGELGYNKDMIKGMEGYQRIRPENLIKSLAASSTEASSIAMKILNQGRKAGWSPARAVATALFSLTLSSEELALFMPVYHECLMWLTDSDYLEVAKELHSICKRSLTFAGVEQNMRVVARMLYLHCLAGRGAFGPKAPLDVEMQERKNRPKHRRNFRDGQWSVESHYRHAAEEANQVISKMSRAPDMLGIEEYNKQRIWHVPSGHGGGAVKAGDLGLENLPGMNANSKLEGKRALNAMLRPVAKPDVMDIRSKPMLKVEPGIPHRRLFPVDYESAGIFEVFEHAAKPLLQTSEYSCLLKTVKHTLLQRMKLLQHISEGKAVASLDAAAWDEQHTADELKLTADVIVRVAKHFDVEVGRELEELGRKLDAAQRRKKVQVEDEEYVIDGSLFSGEGLTQTQNTKAAERALADAVSSLRALLNRAFNAQGMGKGDDITILVTDVMAALCVAEMLRQVGAEFAWEKVLIGTDAAELERCIVSDNDGFSHSVARRMGSMPVAEPQGSLFLRQDEAMRVSVVMRDDMLRYGAHRVDAIAVQKAVLMTERVDLASCRVDETPSCYYPRSAGGLGLGEFLWLGEMEPRMLMTKPLVMESVLQKGAYSKLKRSAAQAQLDSWESTVRSRNRQFDVCKYAPEKELQQPILEIVGSCLPQSCELIDRERDRQAVRDWVERWKNVEMVKLPRDSQAEIAVMKAIEPCECTVGESKYCQRYCRCIASRNAVLLPSTLVPL